MNDNQNEDTISPLKTMGFTALGFLLSGEASGFANAISLGYADAALIHGAFAGGLLYLSHGSHDYMQDDNNATGLKNHFAGFAAGSVLALMSPNPYAVLSEQQETELSVLSQDAIIEYVKEEPRYPALENVSFG